MNQKAIRDAYKVRNNLRQACRTDLLKLCKVLGYKDVSVEVHGPIIEALQKFPGGEDIETERKWEYRPFKPHYMLEGSRQNLFLYPRSHLKTTVITIAHSIQWIINYPNIRVLISSATGDQTELVVGSIKNHFKFNPDFRALFPEFCPLPEKVADFGNRNEFTVPCRTDYTLKESTVWSCSVGKVIAGFRADVIKSSDLVDEQNVKTPGGINEVISHFGHMEPLREGYNAYDDHPPSRGWSDVEGTRYDFGDLYGALLKSSEWNAVIRAALDENGVALWPSRFSADVLESIRKQPHVGDWIFSAQYLNKCIPQGDGLCDPKDVVFVPHHIIRSLQLRKCCIIDLAGMELTKSGDDTVLTVGGFDRDGRPYIPEINCGKFSPEEVIDLMFDIKKRHPDILYYKIEKEAHSRVLLPFLKREMSKRQIYLLIMEIKRDTHISKQQRIRGLRPWLKNSLMRFSDAIPPAIKMKLLEQIAQFPSQSSGVHDDILDTLTDMMQDAETESGVTSDLIADAPDDNFSQFGRQKPRDRFLGFGENGVANWLYGPDPSGENKRFPTGVM